jgi:hypothetical protein
MRWDEQASHNRKVASIQDDIGNAEGQELTNAVLATVGWFL